MARHKNKLHLRCDDCDFVTATASKMESHAASAHPEQCYYRTCKLKLAGGADCDYATTSRVAMEVWHAADMHGM